MKEIHYLNLPQRLHQGWRLRKITGRYLSKSCFEILHLEWKDCSFLWYRRDIKLVDIKDGHYSPGHEVTGRRLAGRPLAGRDTGTPQPSRSVPTVTCDKYHYNNSLLINCKVWFCLEVSDRPLLYGSSVVKTIARYNQIRPKFGQQFLVHGWKQNYIFIETFSMALENTLYY